MAWGARLGCPLSSPMQVNSSRKGSSVAADPDWPLTSEVLLAMRGLNRVRPSVPGPGDLGCVGVCYGYSTISYCPAVSFMLCAPFRNRVSG